MESLFNRRLINAEIKACATKNGLIDMDCLKIFSDEIKQAIKVSEDGDVSGIEELFGKIKESKPHFFKEPTFNGTTNSSFAAPKFSSTFKNAMDISDDEFEALKAQALKNVEQRKH